VRNSACVAEQRDHGVRRSLQRTGCGVVFLLVLKLGSGIRESSVELNNFPGGSGELNRFRMGPVQLESFREASCLAEVEAGSSRVQEYHLQLGTVAEPPSTLDLSA
jgi:hypothetical protein